MKKTLLILLVALATFNSASAGDYDYLIVQRLDGSKQSFNAIGLKLTFEDGNLVATSGGSTASFALADLQKMFFSSEPAGIKEIADSASEAVTVYTISGQAVGQYQNLKEAQASMLPGLYMIKTSKGTIKIAVK